FSARSMALRTARSRSKATNFSPARSAGCTCLRLARRWLGCVTSTIGSERSGSTLRVRVAVGYESTPTSASSLRTASTTLCGCAHAREPGGWRLFRQEGLHVRAHVLEPAGVDGAPPPRPLPPLLGGEQARARIVEPLEEIATGLEEALPRLGRDQGPPGAV